MKLPSPQKLGLPAKFADWRQEQTDAILKAIDAEERFVTLCMPTGSGKSATYVGLQKLLRERMCVLTATKGLQDQLTADFTSAGLRDIRGKSNYRCAAISAGGPMAEEGEKRYSVTVEHAPCLYGVDCPLAIDCTYWQALSNARREGLVSTNYAKWLSTGAEKLEKEIGRFKILTLDEAHAAPDELCGALATELDKSEVEPLVGWPDSGRATHEMPIREWVDWARLKWPLLRDEREMIMQTMRLENPTGSRRREMLGRLRAITPVAESLGRVAGMMGQWVHDAAIKVSPTGRARRVIGVRFDPIWPAPYAENHLFRGVEKVVMVSATVRPKTAEVLGIKPREHKFIEFNSTFPVARRPFIFIPTARVTHKTWDQVKQKIIDRVDEIMDARADRKGLIHSVSYARRNEIYAASRNKHRLVTHDPSETRTVVAEFKSLPASSGKVLISPSISTGWDFPGDEAEYCIIVKVPWPDTRSKVMATRIQMDPEYGSYLIAQELVQMAGRGMRSMTDRFEIFVIDDTIAYSVWRNKHLYPKWFLAAYRKIENDKIPPAPPKIRKVA